MKHTLLYTFGISVLAIATGCKDVQSNDPYIHQMEDSIYKAFPTVNRVSIEVKENTDVLITLGDAELYNAPEEQRNAATAQLAKMSVHFFEKNNYLDKGTVTFVAEENTMNVKPGSEKVYNMGLEPLLNQNGK
ncbi:MAG: hypothetical protein EOP56_17875 [Sphingobacteriales bacterium]|nr:MAG: hypothetical protein EOP56_17875 [Sphingobacteriales bacterium]